MWGGGGGAAPCAHRHAPRSTHRLMYPVVRKVPHTCTREQSLPLGSMSVFQDAELLITLGCVGEGGGMEGECKWSRRLVDACYLPTTHCSLHIASTRPLSPGTCRRCC